MKKRAAIINGIGAKLGEGHFLKQIFEESAYEVEYLEVLGEGNINQIKLKYEPEIVVGFSLGGLVALELIKKYPRAKLVLLATGDKISPENIWFQIAYRLASTKYGLKMALDILKWPEELLVVLYKFFNPMKEIGAEAEQKYEEDMKANIRYFREISFDKWREIVEYMVAAENKKLCLDVNNKCLVVSGIEDKIMPVVLGRRLNEMIPGSKLMITNGGHYNVISKDSLKDLKKFINDTGN